MSRMVCQIEGKFFEFSPSILLPVTDLMSAEEFQEYSRRMYGDLYVDDTSDDGLTARCARAMIFGHSLTVVQPQGLQAMLDYFNTGLTVEVLLAEYFSAGAVGDIVQVGEMAPKSVETF